MPLPAPIDGPLIGLDRVGLNFGSVTALDGVSLEIRHGEFFCLLGPSGCGKSTLLRLVAGFERPDRGRVLLEGRDISDEPPHRRPLNMMFQSYALFPHMTLAENIGYGLRRLRLPKAEIAARVDEMLRLVRLDGLGERSPAQLSGGQRQRGALARALARRPRVLLLDEPLAALDRGLREETGVELKALQARLGTTFVMVTHDQGEAMSLADRLGVMEAGRLIQVGPPRAVYERPANRFVAAFLGDVNLVEGSVGDVWPGGLSIETALRAAPLEIRDDEPLTPATPVTLAIRPERLTILPEGAMPQPNEFAAEPVGTTYLGSTTVLHVRVADGTVWRVSLAGSGDPPPNRGSVRIAFAPDAAFRLG